MNVAFDSARVGLSLAFLIYASWSDFKSREVSNKVWAVLAPIALVLTTLQLLMSFDPQFLQTYILSFTITSIISIALFYAGAFGGADAKALICLSLALPSHPNSLLQQSLGFGYSFFPITVFSNAVLLAASSALYALTRNWLWKQKTGRRLFEGFEEESAGRKILALLCGYKVNIAKLEEVGHLYPLEDVHTPETGGVKRELLIFPKDEDRQPIVDRVLNAKREGQLQDDVWITPGLPMLIFITVGLVIALIFGDIIWSVLRLVTATP
ncbi:MAG: prepilin peptidase [Candidatus Bathyarchaeota archaeon]|nr:MAG: prepilin peptidase [Candidatus Bathyarchaeota archaeon]